MPTRTRSGEVLNVNPRRSRQRAPRGVALVMALIFMAVFVCLAVGVASTAQSNIVIGRNQINTQQSLAMAEGGLGLMLRNLGGADVAGAADAAALHQKIGQTLKTCLAASSMLNANAITWDAGGVHLPTAIVTRADGSAGQFDVAIQANGGASPDTRIAVISIGHFGGAARSVTYRMAVQQGGWTLPPYGITSRGAVQMTGNASLTGANNDKEGGILTATSTANAIQLTGNVLVSGDVVVCNSAGSISKTGNVTIRGNQIINAPQPDWPTVNISPFSAYATTTRTTGGSSVTLSNIRIPPNSNPTFSGNTTINGVVYVQSPNKVSFTGNVTLTGVIVCDTPAAPSLTKNAIKFTGNLQTYGVESLPASAAYDGLRSLTGTFLLAPGFSVQFTGNSTMVNGCLVADKFTFTGNSGGRIKGGIVCLANNPMSLTGNSPLIIDKSNVPTHPAGLNSGGGTRLACVGGSYSQ
jgi:Tfp pilus assembly protein PilX